MPLDKWRIGRAHHNCRLKSGSVPIISPDAVGLTDASALQWRLTTRQHCMCWLHEARSNPEHPALRVICSCTYNNTYAQLAVSGWLLLISPCRGLCETCHSAFPSALPCCCVWYRRPVYNVGRKSPPVSGLLLITILSRRPQSSAHELPAARFYLSLELNLLVKFVRYPATAQ